MSDDSEKQKVLIVDDAPENIQVLMETLKDEYTIVAAINGPKALQLAEAASAPDIVLLDIMMPEMDGYEVCRRLKANRKTRNIPVIFVTAMDQEADETKGLELGAVDYITKPISPAIVRARVKTHLSLKNSQKRLQDLLNKTLSGSVRVLMDVLGLVNPIAFSRSSQLRRLVKDMASELGLADIWKFELAAMLSQIGCVTVPVETMKKLYQGQELTEEEASAYSEYASVGAELLANIPHLESVAEMIAKHQDSIGLDKDIEPRFRDAVLIGGQLIKTAVDYLLSAGPGDSAEAAIRNMRSNTQASDPALVELLSRTLGLAAEKQTEKTVPAKEVSSGMIIDQDVYSDEGTFLIARGTELSGTTIRILQQHGKLEKIKSAIRVLEPKGRIGE